MSEGAPARGEPAGPIRVVLCDDHEMFLEGMAATLRSAGVDVVATARDGRTVLELEERLRPDVIVLDLDLGAGMSGWEVLERRRRRGTDHSRVVIASGLAADSDVQGAVDDGASGYVLKAANTRELVLAIRRAARGLVYFSPDVQHVLVGDGGSGASGAGRATEREAKVLRMVGRGDTDQEIAGQLNVSRTTVRRALDELCAKLGIGGGSCRRHTLIKRAIERGWL